MRSILPLIQLLLVSVPLSCAQVGPKKFTITCEQALKALEGKGAFRRPNEVPVDPKSPNPSPALTYSCLNEGAHIRELNQKKVYMLQDNNSANYNLILYWHKNIKDSHMVFLWKLAEATFKMPEHPNLLNIKKFVKKKVDANGNPVNKDGTKNLKKIRLVYYVLMEWTEPENFGEILTAHPEYADDVPWLGRTLFKVALAAKHLHTNSNIHTRIILDNLFFDAKFEPKLSIEVMPAKKGTPGSFRGSICFMAPEVLALKLILTNNYEFIWSEKQDTYSLGVVMFKMFYPTEFPFGCKEISSSDPEILDRAERALGKKMYKAIRNGDLQVRSKIPFWAIRAMQGLLQDSEKTRWGDDEILGVLEAFSENSAKPNNSLLLWRASDLTVFTPIYIPEGSSDEYITISTIFKLKEPEAFVAQSPEVLKNFDPEDPSFLFEPLRVHRFNLVR